MYKRKIENILQSWLDDTSHKPLVVKGVRQCGKTSSVMDFARKVECKATTGNAKSVQTVLKHPEKYHVTSALKLGDYNIGRMGYLLTLPMYLAFLLREV